MKYERLTMRLLNGKIGCLQEYSQKDLINRLAELEDKIENGTLIELPCKVGDRIWCIINNKHIFGRRIKEIIFKKIGWWIQTVDKTGWADMERFCMQDFGKTVFLTKAEAEKKLKELKGEV